jgi:hypothetical protein
MFAIAGEEGQKETVDMRGHKAPPPPWLLSLDCHFRLKPEMTVQNTRVLVQKQGLRLQNSKSAVKLEKASPVGNS